MATSNGRDGIPRIGRPEGSASAVPFGDQSAGSEAIDIGAVRRDEEFIEAIRGDGPIATDRSDDYQLALLLANWRAEIITPAMPTGPDLDEVAAAVDQEIAAVGLRRTATRTRSSFLRPVAGAAAAIALVMGGLVVFSYNSAPGDPLWSVKSVVFSQQADSTVAQIDTTSRLEQAEQLIASGDVAAAQQLLDGVSATAGAVTDPAQRSELEEWLQRLIEQLQAMVPTIPALLPPAVDPDVAAPVAPEVQLPEMLPLTSVPENPPVSTSPVDIVPPVSSEPVTPPSSEPAPVTTTPSEPTILREPSPTTATASGSADDSTLRSRMNSQDNGG